MTTPLAPEQLDWLRLEDNRASAFMLVAASVERLGVALVAAHMGQTPSALRNQLAGRRSLPDGCFIFCWLLDPLFRSALAGLCGEELIKPPDMTPEEAFRALTAEVIANGFVPKARVLELQSRMKGGGR